MKRIIKLNNQNIEYELSQRQNARYIKIKVVFGKLKVSAPSYVSISKIEDYIKSNTDLIIEQLKETTLANYVNGGYVYILGYRYPIIQIDLKQRKCTMRDGKLYVYGSNIQAIVESYLNAALKQYTQKYIETFVKKHPDFPLPLINYKKTSGRYGACYYKENRVCINPVLIHFKQEFLDSVLIHEMCHFKHHDHSPAFYQEVEKYMPNYQIIHKGAKTYD